MITNEKYKALEITLTKTDEMMGDSKVIDFQVTLEKSFFKTEDLETVTELVSELTILINEKLKTKMKNEGGIVVNPNDDFEHIETAKKILEGK